MKAAAILLLILSLALFAGCKAKVAEPTITNISGNMTDTAQNETIIIVPVVNETAPVVNETIINETPIVNMTNNTVITDPIVEDDEGSEYSEYRDTGMIDDSIEDIESLSE